MSFAIVFRVNTSSRDHCSREKQGDLSLIGMYRVQHHPGKKSTGQHTVRSTSSTPPVQPSDHRFQPGIYVSTRTRYGTYYVPVASHGTREYRTLQHWAVAPSDSGADQGGQQLRRGACSLRSPVISHKTERRACPEKIPLSMAAAGTGLFSPLAKHQILPISKRNIRLSTTPLDGLKSYTTLPPNSIRSSLRKPN